jgi:chromosome segregation ATPase
MAGEETRETISVTLSADVVDWLDEQAETTGTDRERYVQELVSAYHSVAGNNGDVDADLQSLASSSEIERQLEEQRDEYVELIEDVRERVIQVKREADARAPADHDHPELESVERIESDLEAIRATVEELETDLENGFQNYEDVLRYLKDATEESQRHLDTLATAMLDLRSATKRVAAESAARVEADRLKATANKHGFRRADCEECDASVDISLLSKANCPHCSATFVDADPKDGFFGDNTLVTGSMPALEGDVDGEDDGTDLSSILEETPGDEEFDWHEGSGEPSS